MRDSSHPSLPLSDSSALVLVVDDDLGMRQLLRYQMEHQGYQVMTATNGEEALQTYKNTQPDIVLLDALMPVMDGFTCCQQLCKFQGHSPVLMITTLEDAASVRRAFEAGATDYVTKPLNWTILQQRVHRLIEQSRLIRQVQQFNTELEQYAENCNILVRERTALLNKSLEFEATLRRITDRVRDTLDEHQILQTVVQELAWALGSGCCNAGIYSHEQRTSFVQYEYTASIPGYLNRVIQMDHFPEIYDRLLHGKSVQFCSLLPHPHRNRVALFAFPIGNGESIGDLWLIFDEAGILDEMQMRLIEQVSNQCAIAIRQARLYKQSQAQVQELEQLNQLKDDFLSTVSHELRTPVTNIRLSIQLLENLMEEIRAATQKIPTLAATFIKGSSYLKILHNECEQEINLINDLLDLQRLEAGQQPLNLCPIPLQEWLHQEIDPFIVRAQLRQQILQIDLALPLCNFESDPIYLRRLLGELIHNACKYSPAGATITVSVRVLNESIETGQQESKSDVENISISTCFNVSLPVLLLQVTNTGVEIPSSELTRIFDKFYRIPSADPWQQGGTGLGLALVKRLADRMGGSVQVTSGAGQTRFIVILPVTNHGDNRGQTE